MENKAFTAGVVPGGLTNDSQISILVCFIVAKRRNKLCAADIVEILTASGLANYFACVNAVADMTEKGHLIDVGKGALGVSSTGLEIAETLYTDVPLSVRERALTEADGLLALKTNIGQHKVEIIAVENGFNVKCSISDLGTPMFILELYAPTYETASLIKRRFIEFGAKIYGDALAILTTQP